MIDSFYEYGQDRKRLESQDIFNAFASAWSKKGAEAFIKATTPDYINRAKRLQRKQAMPSKEREAEWARFFGQLDSLAKRKG